MPEFEDGLSTMTDPRDTEPVEAADAGKAEAQVSGERPDPLAEAQREAAEFKDKALRTLAEMENLRKRTEREVADARLYGNASFARDVLAVADNMQRALDAIEPELRDDAKVNSLIEGVEHAELPPGHVAQVIQAGYMLGDRVLRPAMVAIVKAAPKQQAAAANGNSADA